MWRNTPHGWAFVPPQPANPMRAIDAVLVDVIDVLIRRAERQPETNEPPTAA